MMRRPFTYCIVFGLLLAPAAFSQNILPTSLPGWNSTTVSATTTVNLDGIAGKASAALVEYGASSAEKRTYVGKGHGGGKFSATLYSFKDESGAYGAYSFLRTPEMNRAEYSEHSMKTRDSALVLTGNLVLEIRGNAVERGEPIIRKLIAQLSVQSEAPVYPSLPLQLPNADLIPKTDHYFLGPVALAQFWPGPSATGDWLGFAAGGEAEIAKYRLKGHEATLLVADYPTPQIAAAQLGRMSKQF
jgi:hypothetical protein